MRKVKELGAGDQVNSMLYVSKRTKLTRKLFGNNISKLFQKVCDLYRVVWRRFVISTRWSGEGGSLEKELGKVMWSLDASLARTVR